MAHCPVCDSYMLECDGYFGNFLGCSTYPDCDITVNLNDLDEYTNEPIHFHYGENFGICWRCSDTDTLSSNGLCNYCSHMWDNFE